MLALVAAWAASAPAASAASPPATVMQAARAAVYEVVVEKGDDRHLRYERPLPLELLSFTERNDRYWSIGTAFAIAPDTFASAAHVLASAAGYAVPALRDAEGRIFPVDQVLRYSDHEDYVVFKVRGAPTTTPLPVSRDPVVGSSVFAAGNALGEGVVLRDGVLTSMTPEDQDGRWKWLRFSAAASPGNSGGPLLDDTGRVLGIIVAKSPNENLNYALPADRFLSAGAGAVFDRRLSFGLPILRAERVAKLQTQFALPVDWNRFAGELSATRYRFNERNMNELLDAYRSTLPPGGESARLFATLETDEFPALLCQDEDDVWHLDEGSDREESELPDGGHVWLSSARGTILFRIARDGGTADGALHADGQVFLDALLKGFRLPRQVGPQQIRILSMGKPAVDEPFTDRFGRTWRLRQASLGYSDLTLVVAALPTPEGYAGTVAFATASSASETAARLRVLADYVHAPYLGSVAQWRTFIAKPGLAPPLVRSAALQADGADGLRARLGTLRAHVPSRVLALGDTSRVTLLTRFQPDGANQLKLEIAGLVAAASDSEESSNIAIYAQTLPDARAGSAAKERWRKLTNREAEYRGEPRYDPGLASFWTRSVIGEAAQGQVFEVAMTLHERMLLPREVVERRDLLLQGLTLGTGAAR